METSKMSSMLPHRALLSGLAAAAFLSAGLFTPLSAEAANTAANATLRNTVTVSYQNAAGGTMDPKTATVDITVTLKAATPTLTLVGTAAQTTELGTAVDYTYTIATNANGPDTYNLTNSITDMAQVGATPSTVEFRTAAGGGGSVITTADLGASTAAAAVAIPASTVTTISVLRDNGAYGSSVNNIANTDTVVFGVSATVCTVSNVTAASGYGVTSFDVSCPAAVAVAIGDPIREVKTVYLRVLPNSILASTTTNQTITVDTSARDAASAAAATAPVPTVTTVLVSQMTVTKYVRNVSPTPGTGNAVCSGGTLTIDTGSGAGSVDYCVGGRTGKPGDILEYVIAITTTAGGGTAKDVKISDPINNYVTYVGSSMRLDPGTGTFVGPLDGANDANDAGEFDPTNKIIYIYAGSGGDDGTAAGAYNDGTGGTLAPNKTSYGVYRVTIN